MLFVRSISRILRYEKQLQFKISKNVKEISTHTRFIPLWNIKLTTDIENILQSPNPSPEEWKYVSNYLAENGPVGEDSTITITKLLSRKQNNFLQIVSYYKYLSTNGFDISMGMRLQFLKYCCTNRQCLTQEITAEIEKTYDFMITQYPFMSNEAIVICLTALSLTPRWRAVLDVIDRNEIHKNKMPSVYSCAVSAAFCNNSLDIAWKYFKQAFENNYYLKSDVYTTYLKVCLKNKRTLKHSVQEMFQAWREYHIVPIRSVIKEYVEALRQEGWDACYTTIFPSGICEQCDKQLKKVDITAAELQDLAETMMKDVVIGEDIYLRSHPKELQEFIKFIEKEKPYKLVIDGLNAYGLTHEQTIAGIIQKFKKLGLRTVVITRDHMMRVPKFISAMKDASVFYVQDQSQDDPYILYAALAGGPGTILLSADQIRDHKFRIGDSKKTVLFTKWELTHKYIPRGDGSLQASVPCEPRAQQQGNIWHVPYATVPTISSLLTDGRISWVCFKF